MNTETPAFEPTEQQVRHHNYVLASNEYMGLEAVLQKLLTAVADTETSMCCCSTCIVIRTVTREAHAVLESNRPWVWTGKRGPVVIEQENAYEVNHGTDPVT